MKIAVYGSLRHEEYNFERFKNIFGEDIKFLKTDTIYGAKLYDLGSYPGINITNDMSDSLTIDVLEVSEKCFKALNNMEIGAGYSPKDIFVGDDSCVIWVYNTILDGKKSQVKHGDWSKFLKEKKETLIQSTAAIV